MQNFSVQTIATGLFAICIAAGLARTRFATVASLVALIVPSVLIALLGWEHVHRVADVSHIPGGIPALTLPNLALLTPESTIRPAETLNPKRTPRKRRRYTDTVLKAHKVVR
jgi:hypothetical protein